MFGKIFAQEFRNSWRIPVILTFVSVILSFIVRMEVIFIENSDYAYGVPDVISTATGIFVFLYVIYMLAANIIVFFSMPVRFYRESFSDIGYLYHSLPVTKSQFFGAHVLVGGIWVLEYFVVDVFCGALVFDAWSEFMRFLLKALEWFYRELRAIRMQDGFVLILLVILICWLIIVTPFAQVTFMNASVCLGQNFRKHRVAGAVLMYFLITFIMNMINQTVLWMLFFSAGYFIGDDTILGTSTPAIAWYICLLLAVALALQIIELMILWIISTKHLENKLNLE